MSIVDGVDASLAAGKSLHHHDLRDSPPWLEAGVCPISSWAACSDIRRLHELGRMQN